MSVSPEPTRPTAATGAPDLDIEGWLDDNWDPDLTVAEWWSRLAAHRLSHVTFPEPWGRGWSRPAASQLAKSMTARGALGPPSGIGAMLAAPTLLAHGSPSLVEALVPAILNGGNGWCQLFSEPVAGSDLAGIQTRAVRDGDEWIVSGQKVWTSLGQFAQWGILLARTDPTVPKHEGITYFLVDMATPGIEVRPLVQMTGSAHFNETFLTDVRIPKENVVGEVGDGWAVARTTLTSERSSIAGGKTGWNVELLIEAARIKGVADDPIVRQGLARAHTQATNLRTLGYRIRTALSMGTTPGREMLIMKLAYARHWTESSELAMHILGAEGMLAGSDEGLRAIWPFAFLNQYAVRLGGGTDEVQQNIMAELGLGLPREPSADRGVPWKDLPR